MQWAVNINDKSFKVEIPDRLSDDQPFMVTINGKRRSVRWQRTTQTLYTREGDGFERSICLRTGSAQRFPGESGIEVASEYIEGGVSGPQYLEATVTPHIPGQDHRNKAAGDKGTIVRSRITGKVLKVNVKHGDEVAPGQTLLIIEAMKMENKIFCGNGGKVTAVSVAEGDAVTTGAELVRIES